jgi:hypothetical protein
MAFVACVDTPIPDGPPVARVIVSWDPLACGPPHRIAVELEDEAGVAISASTPCTQGSLSLDAPHFGIYRGRIYAWVAGEAIRSITSVRIAVDEAVVRWIVATPP